MTGCPLLSGCVRSASNGEGALVVVQFAPGIVDAEVEEGVGIGGEGEGGADGEGGFELPIAGGVADEEASEKPAEGLAAIVAGTDAGGFADPSAGGVAEDDATVGGEVVFLSGGEREGSELPASVGEDSELFGSGERGSGRGGGKLDGGAGAVPAVVEFFGEELPFGFELRGEEIVEVGFGRGGGGPVLEPTTKNAVIMGMVIEETEETPAPGVGGEFLIIL